jgi:hypothetical protein
LEAFHDVDLAMDTFSHWGGTFGAFIAGFAFGFFRVADGLQSDAQGRMGFGESVGGEFQVGKALLNVGYGRRDDGGWWAKAALGY